jgi:hypothetical protein
MRGLDLILRSGVFAASRRVKPPKLPMPYAAFFSRSSASRILALRASAA